MGLPQGVSTQAPQLRWESRAESCRGKQEAEVRSEGAKDRVISSVLSFSYSGTKDKGSKSDREPCTKQELEVLVCSTRKKKEKLREK